MSGSAAPPLFVLPVLSFLIRRRNGCPSSNQVLCNKAAGRYRFDDVNDRVSIHLPNDDHHLTRLLAFVTHHFQLSEALKSRLPVNVIYQFAPLDTPVAVEAFLSYWKPNALILLESELWPNLIMGAAKNGVTLALLNARISTKSFQRWSVPVTFPLAELLLSKFSLIVPLSNTQAVQFQLLQARPCVIRFSGDLKYASDDSCVSEGDHGLQELHEQLIHRKVWIASSFHKGEERIMLKAHSVLKEVYPDIVTILVPRHPRHAHQIALALQKKGISVALRSQGDTLTLGTQIYIVDTLGELREFYRLAPIAVIGGSFFPGLAGHNISEAAVAGCAILTGHYVGHFKHMVQELQHTNPSSVLQVSEDLLIEALIELFSDAKVLEARRQAAEQAFRALSRDIVENTWRMVVYSSSVLLDVLLWTHMSNCSAKSSRGGIYSTAPEQVVPPLVSIIEIINEESRQNKAGALK